MSTLTTLPRALDILEHLEANQHKVLSAYIDTAPDRLLSRAYVLAFRDACKTLRPSLTEGERTDFEQSVSQIEQYLTEGFHPEQRGQAVFAGSAVGECLVVPLPEPTLDGVRWDALPDLAPLEEALDDFARYGVLVIDKEQARLFSIRLGQIEEVSHMKDDVPGKQATGGWYGMAQKRMAAHQEDIVLRHVKRAIGLLADMQRRRPFDRLFLAGPDEVIPMARHLLPRPLRSRLAGVLAVELFATDDAVLQATLQAAEGVETADEVAQVVELLDSTSSRHAEVGVEATMSALRDGRVHSLLIAADLSQSAFECTDCLAVTMGVLTECPQCGGQSLERRDIRELAVEEARAQSARVETVRGEAGIRLLQAGGMGAWTRY